MENSSDIDPNSSGDGVILNNPSPLKKPLQSPMRKNFFFTYNNYSIDEIDPIVATLKKFAYKGKIQSEVGANGTKHLQGQIWCDKKHRDTEFKLSKKIHWETLKDTENIRDYCGKEDTHDGVFRTSWGFPKPIKIIENLYPWQKNIENIILKEPDERTINWFWEPNGNIGKSAFVKYLVVKHKVLFCCSGKYADLINLVFNTNMDEANCVVFDIPRANEGHISYAALESIKNGLVCNTKYETGSKVFNSPHIIIFANFPPDEPQLLSNDRWNIVRL